MIEENQLHNSKYSRHRRSIPCSIFHTICTGLCWALLCFVITCLSQDLCDWFIHILQGCITGTGAIIWLPLCQWSNPEGYGYINGLYQTTTKHNKAWTVCIMWGMHDDVKWKHFPRYWPFVMGNNQSPVDSLIKASDVPCGDFIFSVICAWTNSWAKNQDACDLRHHYNHYDVAVKVLHFLMTWQRIK